MTQLARTQMPDDWAAISIVLNRKHSQPDNGWCCIDASLPPHEVGYAMLNAVAQNERMGLWLLLRTGVELLLIRIARRLRILRD